VFFFPSRENEEKMWKRKNLHFGILSLTNVGDKEKRHLRLMQGVLVNK